MKYLNFIYFAIFLLLKSNYMFWWKLVFCCLALWCSREQAECKLATKFQKKGYSYAEVKWKLLQNKLNRIKSQNFLSGLAQNVKITKFNVFDNLAFFDCQKSVETIRLHRLVTQTLPIAIPQIGKIFPFLKLL